MPPRAPARELRARSMPCDSMRHPARAPLPVLAPTAPAITYPCVLLPTATRAMHFLSHPSAAAPDVVRLELARPVALRTPCPRVCVQVLVQPTHAVHWRLQAERLQAGQALGGPAHTRRSRGIHQCVLAPAAPPGCRARCSGAWPLMIAGRVTWSRLLRHAGGCPHTQARTAAWAHGSMGLHMPWCAMAAELQVPTPLPATIIMIQFGMMREPLPFTGHAYTSTACGRSWQVLKLAQGCCCTAGRATPRPARALASH